MNRRLNFVLGIAGLLLCMSFEKPAKAQDSRVSGPEAFLTIPAVSGYEQELAAEIRETLKDLSPKADNIGNVIVTLGSGAPHRLIVTPMDEPGYVVSAITSDGYLRVQRLPQRAPNAVFDLLHAAQPVWVMTRGQKKIPGVFTGLSVHLQPGRKNGPTMAHPDEMYVDIGATSAQEVQAAGVDLLDPIALNRTLQNLGDDERTAPAIGDRFGCEALAALLHMLQGHTSNLRGTLTIAFVTQQWTGGRGLDRLLNEVHPDEMIYVARVTPPRVEDSKPGAATASSVAVPGAGVLLGVSDVSGTLTGLAADLKKMGDEQHVTIKPVLAAPPTMTGYAKPTPLPAQFAHLGVASLYPVTPAETISNGDIAALETLLYRYAVGAGPESGGG